MQDKVSFIAEVALIGHRDELTKSNLGEELGAIAAEWGQALSMEKQAYEQRGFNRSGPSRFGGDSRGKPQSNREDPGSPAFRDMAMVAGIGGAIGLALASRKGNALRAATAERLMGQTENLRSLGNAAGSTLKDATASKDKQFEDLFKDIEDPAKRKYVEDTTRSISKLIGNLGHNTYYFNKDITHPQLKQFINAAQEANEIPPSVAQYLHRELDSSIRMNPTGSPQGGPTFMTAAPRTPGSSRSVLDMMGGN